MPSAPAQRRDAPLAYMLCHLLGNDATAQRMVECLHQEVGVEDLTDLVAYTDDDAIQNLGSDLPFSNPEKVILRKLIAYLLHYAIIRYCEQEGQAFSLADATLDDFPEFCANIYDPYLAHIDLTGWRGYLHSSTLSHQQELSTVHAIAMLFVLVLIVPVRLLVQRCCCSSPGTMQ